MKVWVCEESNLEIYESEEAARAAYKVFCKETGTDYDEELFQDCYKPVEVWGVDDCYKQFQY